jgi:hypothetical protein
MSNEVGDWVPKVAAHPLYAELIKKMVSIELARNQVRAQNAAAFAAVMRAPTGAAFNAFRPIPIGPGLIGLHEIRPATAEELGIQVSINASRDAAKSAVIRVRDALDKAKKSKPALVAKIEDLLGIAQRAADAAIQTSNVEIASAESRKATAAADTAFALVTPILERALLFIKDPKVFIPVLVAAGILLIASPGEGD